MMKAGKASFELKNAVGGKTRVSVDVVPELELRLGAFDALLRPAHVLLSQTTPDSQWYYGRLGFDVLHFAHQVTIDFDALTLTLE